MEGDRERGYFELDFIGWVETSSMTPEGELNGSVSVEGFRPSIVSIRAVEKRRAELVYVTALSNDFDTAGTSDYGKLAKAYWDSLKDNRVAENSYLKRILDEMVALEPSLRNGLPLGVVNIVSHGGTKHWWIRWDKKWTSGDKTYDEEPPAWIKGIGAGDLLMGGSLRLEPAPDASVLDDASLVVLWACDVGWNPALLKDVRAQFGGKAQVLAPKFHVVYRQRNGVTKPYLAEFWTLERRGTVDWPDEDSLARQLEEEYSRPSAPIVTYRSWISSDWAKIAQIVSEHTDEDAFRTREVVSATFTAENLDHDEILDENDQLLSESKLLNRLFINDPKNPTPEELGRRDMADHLGWTFVDPPARRGANTRWTGRAA